MGCSKISSILTICVIISGIFAVTQAQMEYTPIKELPTGTPTCVAENANLNECMKSAFQQMLPRVKNGLKELNIPPMDPFVLNKTTYQYSNGILNGRFLLKDVHIYGMSNSIVQDVDFKRNKNKMRMTVTTFLPSLYAEGKYKADVKLNDLKLTPKGYFNITMTNMKMVAKPEGEFYKKDGHTYLRLNNFDADPTIEDMKIYVSNIFPDPAMNEVILEFINQNWPTIYKSVIPETRAIWEPFIIKGANDFFGALPIEYVLPNSEQ